MKKIIYTPADNEILSRYMCDVRKFDLLSDEEESRLSSAIRKGGRAGKRALDKLVSANLRFAIFVAKQYQGMGNELNDLIQDASQGLIEAANMFDASHGVKFVSYAISYVKKHILLGIQRNGHTIRKPKDFFDVNSKYQRLFERIYQTEMREPTLEEFEMVCDLSHEKAAVIYNYIINRTVSLDEVCFDDSDSTVGDSVAGFDNADVSLERSMLRSQVDSMCQVLKPRTRDILYDIFGLNTGYSLTNVEIADKYNVDQEQIRKIKARAIERVRRCQLQCA